MADSNDECSGVGGCSKALTSKTINPNLLKINYAIRGPIMTRLIELQKEVAQGIPKPFDTIIRANVGDSQALGQKPLTFIRQMLALCTYPELFNSPEFPEDVKNRARRILNSFLASSVGSYTDSAGNETVRRDIAAFIERRDGFPADYRHVFFTAGATEAIEDILQLVLTSPEEKPAGIMIPIPQYPIYSALIAKHGAHQINYYLDEDNDWSLDLAELHRALDEARDHCTPRMLCVINPGNPTGQVLNVENMKEIIRFAHDNRLVLLADEVYQENVFRGKEWNSFRKVIMSMEAPYCHTELASCHSASKGCIGECGLRGGYMQLINFAQVVYDATAKLYSTKHPGSLGQVVIDIVVNPPVSGEPSHDTYMEEKKKIFDSLEQRAKLITMLFNSIEGISCRPITGALYALPRVFIPERAVDEAAKCGMSPDAFYCFQLLEDTGICVVPGSGFGQRPGTYHFRITILPQLDVIEELVARFRVFHMKFLKHWK